MYVLETEGQRNDIRAGRRIVNKDLGKLVEDWKRNGMGRIEVVDKVTTISAPEISPPCLQSKEKLREPVSASELIDFYNRMGLESPKA